MVKLLNNRLDPHQKKASKFVYQKGGGALFMPPGSGKTITALFAVARWWKRAGVRNVLVVGPKIAKGVWQTQIVQHVALATQIYVVSSRDDVRETCNEIFRRDDDALRFLIINYDLVSRRINDLRDFDFDVIILDESHRIRRWKTAYSRTARRLVGQRRMILTGTFGDADLDLWAQVEFLKPGLLHRHFKIFARKWCRRSGYQLRDFKLKKHRREEFLNRVSPYIYEVPESELPKIPSRVVPVYFDLSRKVLRAYREMEETFSIEVEGIEVVNKLTITNMLRLQQLASGFIDGENEEGPYTIHFEKDRLNTLSELLLDIPIQKTVVFVRFIEEIHDIAKRFHNRDILIIRGGQDNTPIWQGFQKSKKKELVICQIAAGGLSIDLFAASLGIFYSRTFSWIEYFQAMRRLKRRGQRKYCTFYLLIGNNTIDVDLDNSLKDKGNTASDVLRQLKRRRKSIGQV